MCWGPICRVGLSNLTKHEETLSPHDHHPTATTLSLPYLPFLIEFSYICNHVTHKPQPRETVSVQTVITGWHNSRKTGREVALLFDEAACVQMAQTYTVTECSCTHIPTQHTVCACSVTQAVPVPYSILLLLVYRTLMYFTVLYCQEVIMRRRRTNCDAGKLLLIKL